MIRDIHPYLSLPVVRGALLALLILAAQLLTALPRQVDATPVPEGPVTDMQG